MDGFGNSGGVPGDLLGDTSARLIVRYAMRRVVVCALPYVDTGASKSRVLDSNGLLAVHAAGSSSSGETTTADTEDQKVAFLGSGCHDCGTGGKVS